jgi:hypothetical protein
MYNKLLCLALLVAAGGVCQSSLAMGPVGSAVDKINLLQGLSTWEALDERHLVLSLGAKQNYLVTLSHNCHTLPFATHLGVSASDNIVYAGFDYITADGQQCAINTINELSDEQRRALIQPVRI